MVESEKDLQDLRTNEEFQIHVKNLKKVAIRQFDQERYGDCLGTFKFLCELEPGNEKLQNYLEKCLEMAEESPSLGTRQSQVAKSRDPISGSGLALMGKGESWHPSSPEQDHHPGIELECVKQAQPEAVHLRI